MSEPVGELILYRADDGDSVVQLRAVGGTMWLTRGEMADLHGTTPQDIGQVVTRVLADSEATRKSEFLVRRESRREIRRQVDGVTGRTPGARAAVCYLSGNVVCYA